MCQLVNVVQRARFIARLRVVIFADWEDDYIGAPNRYQARFLIMALASFACKGEVIVEWWAGHEDYMVWVPWEFRVMAAECRQTIVL